MPSVSTGKSYYKNETFHRLKSVLSTFVRKFTKGRCVTYLAKDGLAPKHEEDESAIRQMLKILFDSSSRALLFAIPSKGN